MSICRTCLSTKDLTPIFTDKNHNVTSEQLLLVTGVKITPNDALPQKICQRCVTLVSGALKLREQSQKSERVLKNPHLKFETKIDIKTEKIPKYDKYIIIVNKKKFIKQPPQNSEEKKISDYSCLVKGNDKCKEKNTIKDENNENSDVSLDGKEAEDNVDSDIDIKKNDIDRSEPIKKKRKSKEHLKKYMSLAVKPYSKSGPVQCRLCHKEVRLASYFLNHAKTHFKEHFACETCGKTFVNEHSLRYHKQRLHGAQRPPRLACSSCEYHAVDTMQLKNHERAVHTGERPYICDVCGDSFRLRAGVAQHMRKHFAVKTLQCEYCPTMFKSSSELAMHRDKVHLMAYTYLCYMCPRKYKAVKTVKDHLVREHGIPREKHPTIKFVKTKRVW